MTEEAASRASDRKLARMAGQIAGYFSAYPQERAVAGVAEHINQFWSAQMRADLLALVENAPAMLHPLVIEAAALIRSTQGRRDNS